MAIEKKRMQQRYGSYTAFKSDQQNLLPNEFAGVTSGDPNTTSGKALYYAFGPGDARRLMTAEDAENTINSAIDTAIQNVPDTAIVKNHIITFSASSAQEGN